MAILKSLRRLKLMTPMTILGLLIILILIVSSVEFNTHVYQPRRNGVQDAGESIRNCLECLPPIKECKMTHVLRKRYESLSHDSSYLFAMNLYNSEKLMRNLIRELPIVLELLGNKHTMVSIYESGSKDRTGTLLKILALELEIAGINTHISTGMDGVDWSKVFRIEALAKIRNNALQPLFDDIQSVNLNHSIPKFSKVVFLNDIFFCAADILELILQQSRSGATMACPLDVEAPNGFNSFYDLWVARTMSGDLLYDAFNNYTDGADNNTIPKSTRAKMRSSGWNRTNALDIFWQDPIGKLRSSLGLPSQVYSCWNGGVVIDSRPFYDHNLKFRSGHPGECKESECSLFCKDLWNLGYGKIALIPNILVSYTEKEFRYFRTKWESLKEPSETPLSLYTPLLTVNNSLNVSYSIDWKPIPRLVKCFALNHTGERHVNWLDAEMIDPRVVFHEKT